MVPVHGCRDLFAYIFKRPLLRLTSARLGPSGSSRGLEETLHSTLGAVSTRWPSFITLRTMISLPIFNAGFIYGRSS